jgi:pimeloyl-ACP methyl ester carboxylesterase
MQNGSIVLEDGRVLGYATYGPAKGDPVFYFHGTPSSRLEPQLLSAYAVDVEDLLQRSNILLFAVDRPGMGLSAFHPTGNFLSVARDVKQVADYFNIRACSVMGWSGGGPYALAMAYQYPLIVRSVFILCGFSRHFDNEVFQVMGFNKWYFRLARYSPWLLMPAMHIVSKTETKRFVPQKFSGLAYVDYVLLDDPARLKAVASNTLKEACRDGARGPIYEAQSYFKGFGFSLSEIKQPVHYWWGTLDMSVSRVHAEAVEQLVPGAVMHYWENEGHLSMYIKGFPEALQLIAALH